MMPHFYKLVLLVGLTTAGAAHAHPGAPFNQDPATVHYMNINPGDGEYHFGYTAADSAREERRHADGTVNGKYSYTSPEGKLVQVRYGAGAGGFQAYGDHIPPPDTPEVKLAKEQFMAAYARELARISREPPTTSLEGAQSGNELGEPVDETEDSEVVVAGGEDAKAADAVVGGQGSPSVQSPSLMESQNLQNNQLPTTIPDKINEKATKTRPHHYDLMYGIVGSPYYGGIKFPGPTFLIPIPISAFARVSAVHDAQIPNYAQRNLYYNRRRIKA